MQAENPKKIHGDLKPGIHYLPMATLDGVCVVMKGGPDKGGAGLYGLRNWRLQPIRASTYYDAIWRHTCDWFEKREDRDSKSGQSHLHHIIANAMLVLDSIEHGTLVDDRGECEALTQNAAKEAAGEINVRSLMEYAARDALVLALENDEDAAAVLKLALPHFVKLAERLVDEVRASA